MAPKSELPNRATSFRWTDVELRACRREPTTTSGGIARTPARMRRGNAGSARTSLSGSRRFRSATGRARQANLERGTGRSRVLEYESPSRTRKAPKNTETGLAAGFAPFSRRKRGD